MQLTLPIAASKKIILTVNFKRFLIQSRRFWNCRRSVFPLFIDFVYSVIVVFCRYLCTRLWSLCCDVAFVVVSDVLTASRLASSIRSPMNFNRRSPEEFQ